MVNLKNINDYSLQEVFDHVVKHLRNQKKQAIIGAVCQYRMQLKGKTLCCAIGSMIPEKDYVKKIEGESVTSLLANYYNSQFKDMSEKMYNLLNGLQNIHDGDPIGWEECLEDIAKRYELTYTKA